MGLQKGVNYFKYLCSGKKMSWYQGYNLAREYIVTMNRIRANHYNLAESLARVNIIENSQCKCGEYEEDIDHVVWQCKEYESQRATLLKHLKKMGMHLPLNVVGIVEQTHSDCCK